MEESEKLKMERRITFLYIICLRLTCFPRENRTNKSLAVRKMKLVVSAYPTHTHTHLHTQNYTQADTHTPTHIDLHTSGHTPTHTDLNTLTNTDTYTYTDLCTHKHT